MAGNKNRSSLLIFIAAFHHCHSWLPSSPLPSQLALPSSLPLCFPKIIGTGLMPFKSAGLCPDFEKQMSKDFFAAGWPLPVVL
jgi:hypothetical protein